MTKKTVCGLVALLVLVLGGLGGYAVTFLPRMLAGVLVVLFTAFVMFTGMVLASVRHRQMAAEKSRDDEEVISNLHQSAKKLLAAQSRTYGEVSKAMSQIVSNRVGIRIVEEMLHGLENDEQRDAAYRQVGTIIEEELAKLNKDVFGDKSCPEKGSKG
jgi:hypothetical protein